MSDLVGRALEGVAQCLESRPSLPIERHGLAIDQGWVDLQPRCFGKTRGEAVRRVETGPRIGTCLSTADCEHLSIAVIFISCSHVLPEGTASTSGQSCTARNA